MTCKDCIYFNSTEHLKPEWVGSNRCDKHTADGYQEYVGEDCEVCKDFENNHCSKLGEQLMRSGYVTKVQGFKAL